MRNITIWVNALSHPHGTQGYRIPRGLTTLVQVLVGKHIVALFLNTRKKNLWRLREFDMVGIFLSSYFRWYNMHDSRMYMTDINCDSRTPVCSFKITEG